MSATLLTVGLAACGDEPVEWPDDPPSANADEPPAWATDDPAEAAAVDDILAAVRGYREVETEAHLAGIPTHQARRQLTPYLADPLLSRVLGTIEAMRQADVVFEGRPGWEPAVVDLDLDASPPVAVVHDCRDISDWQSVFRESGEPVSGDRPPDRHVERLDATLYPDDGWLLHDARIEEDAQC